MSHTYAYLDVQPGLFVEIRKLLDVDYQHTFGQDDDGVRTIDMHGIALREDEPAAAVEMPAAWLVLNAPKEVTAYVASLVSERDDLRHLVEVARRQMERALKAGEDTAARLFRIVNKDCGA